MDQVHLHTTLEIMWKIPDPICTFPNGLINSPEVGDLNHSQPQVRTRFPVRPGDMRRPWPRGRCTKLQTSRWLGIFLRFAQQGELGSSPKSCGKPNNQAHFGDDSQPIGSMYAIYGNIYHQYTPNVSIYTIHGSYGQYTLNAPNSFWDFNIAMLAANKNRTI